MTHTEKNGSGCWRWTGALKGNGYGSCSYNGKSGQYPHKMMLEAKLGRPLRPGHETRHTCDNRACVNPAHLLEGTRSDNMRDCVERGRHVGVPPKNIGADHPNSRLTEADVLAMRSSGETNDQLALRYGIAVGTVREIKARRKWSHLP